MAVKGDEVRLFGACGMGFGEETFYCVQRRDDEVLG